MGKVRYQKFVATAKRKQYATDFMISSTSTFSSCFATALEEGLRMITGAALAAAPAGSHLIPTAIMPAMVPTKMLLWESVGVAKRVVVPTEIVARTEPVAASRA